jgi:hypothetical protein
MRLHWVLWQDKRRLRIPLSKLGLAWRIHQAAMKAYVEGKPGYNDPPTLYLSLRKRP